MSTVARSCQNHKTGYASTPILSYSPRTSVLLRRSQMLSLPAAFAALVLVFLPAAPASAQFLDLTTLTSGTSGSFTGTLGAVSVTGAITTTAPSFSFSPIGNDFFETTIDNTSPQYSYAGIYTPTQTLGDKVGYVKLNVPNQTATFTINFGSAVTNPIFHIANLDGANFDFGLPLACSALHSSAGMAEAGKG